jgi:hypothetical protein
MVKSQIAILVTMPKIHYECKESIKGVLYTFKVNSEGKKKRVKNTEASNCNNIKACPGLNTLCDRKIIKESLPCKKKNTVFANKKDASHYCRLKRAKAKDAPYRKAKREKVARKANSILKNEPSSKKGTKTKRVVRFAV